MSEEELRLFGSEGCMTQPAAGEVIDRRMRIERRFDRVAMQSVVEQLQEVQCYWIINADHRVILQ